MREQRGKVQTGAMQKYLLIAVTLILMAVAIYTAITYFSAPKFIAPQFDATAQSGTPSPAKSMGYSEVSAENGVRFSLASTIYQQEDGSLLIYLTNPEASQCIICCEIKDEAGETLYKSGAIRHGEYVERLTPQKKIENVATPITIWIYAFEPETWYSVGEVQLYNTLQPY